MPATKQQQEKALSVLAPAAVKIERETRLPAELAVAQVCLESDWLQEKVGDNNAFGIKRAKRHKKGAWSLTSETVNDAGLEEVKRKARRIESIKKRADGRWDVRAELEFADYDTFEEGLRDYASLITNGVPYAKAWAKYSGDWKALAKDIGSIYATGSGYSDLVIRIGSQNNVQAAIAKARAT